MKEIKSHKHAWVQRFLNDASERKHYLHFYENNSNYTSPFASENETYVDFELNKLVSTIGALVSMSGEGDLKVTFDPIVLIAEGFNRQQTTAQRAESKTPDPDNTTWFTLVCLPANYIGKKSKGETSNPDGTQVYYVGNHSYPDKTPKIVASLRKKLFERKLRILIDETKPAAVTKILPCALPNADFSNKSESHSCPLDVSFEWAGMNALSIIWHGNTSKCFDNEFALSVNPSTKLLQRKSGTSQQHSRVTEEKESSNETTSNETTNDLSDDRSESAQVNSNIPTLEEFRFLHILQRIRKETASLSEILLCELIRWYKYKKHESQRTIYSGKSLYKKTLLEIDRGEIVGVYSPASIEMLEVVRTFFSKAPDEVVVKMKAFPYKIESEHSADELSVVIADLTSAVRAEADKQLAVNLKWEKEKIMDRKDPFIISCRLFLQEAIYDVMNNPLIFTSIYIAVSIATVIGDTIYNRIAFLINKPTHFSDSTYRQFLGQYESPKKLFMWVGIAFSALLLLYNNWGGFNFYGFMVNASLIATAVVCKRVGKKALEGVIDHDRAIVIRRSDFPLRLQESAFLFLGVVLHGLFLNAFENLWLSWRMSARFTDFGIFNALSDPIHVRWKTRFFPEARDSVEKTLKGLNHENTELSFSSGSFSIFNLFSKRGVSAKLKWNFNQANYSSDCHLVQKQGLFDRLEGLDCDEVEFQFQ